MNRKIKLGIGGLGFLGLNGVTFPLLENNLRSLRNSLGNFDWGGPLRSRRGIRENDYQLELDSNSSNSPHKLTLEKDSLKPTKLQLSDTKDDSPVSLNTSALGSNFNEGYIDSIKSIFEEITRESGLKKVGKEVEEEFQKSVRDKLEKDGKDKVSVLREFNKAKEIIKEWKSTNSTSSTKVLTPEQRSSLKKLYELLYELTTKKRNFFGELNQVNKGQNGDLGSTKISIPDPTQISQALRVLGWDRSNFGPLDKNLNHWNLLSPIFVNQEELSKLLGSKKQQEKEIQRQLSQSRANAGMWGYKRAGEHYQQQQKQLKSSLKNTSGEIQLHIGSKFLEWIESSQKEI